VSSEKELVEFGDFLVEVGEGGFEFVGDSGA